MKKLGTFLSKPRGIYFSIVALLTIAVGLMTISFSYYVPTSTNTTEMKVSDLNNNLSIDGVEGLEVSLESLEVKEITLKVKSENEINSIFHIFYNNSNINVELLSDEENIISAGEEKLITVRLTNLVEESSIIDFNIVSGFVGNDLNVDGIIII